MCVNRPGTVVHLSVVSFDGRLGFTVGDAGRCPWRWVATVPATEPALSVTGRVAVTPTRWALVALVALGIVLTGAAITLVPWRVPGPSRAERAAALGDVPAGVVTGGRALHA